MDKHDRSYLNRLSLKNPWHLIALGFGSGLLPKAPGTFGSIAAVPLCMLLLYCHIAISGIIIILTFFIGWKAASVAEKDMGVHDNSAIVIDEFVGMFISVWLLPPHWYLALLGFVLFRFFDVLKPYPISWFDKKIGGGLGIMLDDVLAGIFALIVALLIVRLIV